MKNIILHLDWQSKKKTCLINLSLYFAIFFISIAIVNFGTAFANNELATICNDYNYNNPSSHFVNATGARELTSKATLSANGKQVHVLALWDTGAHVSCISHRVVKALNLRPSGTSVIHTPSGMAHVNTYLVDVTLPNGTTFRKVNVCDTAIGSQGIGILIGMDIISKGDFSINNSGGKPTFSFKPNGNSSTIMMQNQKNRNRKIHQPKYIIKRGRLIRIR